MTAPQVAKKSATTKGRQGSRAKSKPTKVSAKSKPTKVSAKSKPTKVSAKSKPTKVAAKSKPTKVAAKSKPTKVSAKSKPTKVAAKSRPTKVSAKSKPTKVAAKSRPTKPNAPRKPVRARNAGSAKTIQERRVWLTVLANETNPNVVLEAEYELLRAVAKKQFRLPGQDSAAPALPGRRGEVLRALESAVTVDDARPLLAELRALNEAELGKWRPKRRKRKKVRQNELRSDVYLGRKVEGREPARPNYPEARPLIPGRAKKRAATPPDKPKALRPSRAVRDPQTGRFVSRKVLVATLRDRALKGRYLDGLYRPDYERLLEKKRSRAREYEDYVYDAMEAGLSFAEVTDGWFSPDM